MACGVPVLRPAGGHTAFPYQEDDDGTEPVPTHPSAVRALSGSWDAPQRAGRTRPPALASGSTIPQSLIGPLLLMLLLAACGRGATGPAPATTTPEVWRGFPTAGVPGPERDGGYARNDRIAPGESLTYFAGPEAPEGPTTLSRREIFQDPADGLRFTYGYDEVESRSTVRCESSPARDGAWGHGPSRQNRGPGTVTVRVDCRGAPERIAVENGSSVPIRVERIATFVLEGPRAADTYARNDVLPPGGSVAYAAGPDAPEDAIAIRDRPLLSRERNGLHLELESGGARVTFVLWCGWPYSPFMPGLRDAGGREAGRVDVLLDCGEEASLIVVDSDARVPVRVRRIASAAHATDIFGSSPGRAVRLFSLRLTGDGPAGESFVVRHEAAGSERTVETPLCGAAERDGPTPPCAGGTTYREVIFGAGEEYRFVRRSAFGDEEVFHRGRRGEGDVPYYLTEAAYAYDTESG